MLAELKVYKDCATEEPTKVYTCRRLLFGVSKKALAISEKMQGKTEMDQIDRLVDLLQAIFPNFERDDIEYIDAGELGEFINKIVADTNAQMIRAQKN